MPRAFLSLGANLGDRATSIRRAIELLSAHPEIILRGVSCLYETEPVGGIEQGWFLNAAVEIETTLNPHDLLGLMLETERQLGRVRLPDERWGPRTIDIDLLFYDDRVLDEPNLQLPHPRLHQRAFVLVPMLELAPDFMHPALGRTISELHLALEAPEDVRLHGDLQPAR